MAAAREEFLKQAQPLQKYKKMNSFNIENNSGGLLTFQTLDGLQIANAETKDIFDSQNGKFKISDVIGNAEIQNLLDNNVITITDEYGGLISSLRLYFGIIPIKISPPQLTAHVNDWNPIGFETASIVNVDIIGIKEIKGMKAGSDGDRKLIVNVSPYELKLSYNDSGSLGANRIWTVEQADYKIKKYGTCEIIYDISISRWRTIAGKKN